MSNRIMKRPSSAKRHIRYENFNQFVSATRLRRVQELLDSDEGEQNSTGIDAILCISGIDSRYNEGTSELINYLLFGFYDVRKAELEKSGFPDEIIDDLMLLIRKTSVDVYCNPINWHYFLPYVSHWTNVTFHCLQDEEYDLESDSGAEKAEAFKIQSLISMTQGCHHIGIPYYGILTAPEKHQFDKMLIEKWPIIQAFALDDYGGIGFFTLSFKVSDISNLVHKFHSVQDPVSIEVLVTENLPILERQWQTMCECTTLETSSKKGTICQEIVGEPLQSFFQHGRVGTVRHKSWNCKVPFVLLGQNSCKSAICALQNSTTTSGQWKLNSSDDTGHMVCQVMSPRSPLTCTRTYFLSHLLTPSTSGECEANVLDTRAKLRYLVRLYSGMVDAVIAGIQVYTQTASVIQARSKVWEILREHYAGIMNASLSAYLSDKSQVVFSIESVQKYGSLTEVREGQHDHFVKVATLSLYDIPGLTLTEPSPGSLIFAESFLESVIQVASSAQMKVDYDILFLTSHIPRHITWGVDPNIKEQHKDLQSKLETASDMGAVLMSGDKVELTSGSFVTLPPETVSLYFYENGLAVYNESYGAFTLHASDCHHIELFDGDSMSTAVLLMVTYHARSSIKLPPHLVTSGNILLFLFPPHSKAHTHLYGQVLTGWKQETEMPPVNRIERNELPEKLEELHTYLQHLHKDSGHAINIGSSSNITLKMASHNIPQLPQFLTHLTASTALGGVPVNWADLPPLLEREQDFSVTPENNKMVVTILTGAPGSEKQSLCDNLAKLEKDYIRWVVVQQMEEAVLETVQLQKMMTSAVTSHLQQDKNKRQTRILLLAPGFVNTQDVVNAILQHPDTKTRNMLKIGAITACINPLNTFMQNRMLLLALLNQCAQGWVNNIIFTSQTKTPSPLLDNIQSIIRSINSDVALLLAEGGEVKRSTDLDQILSDSAFEQPAMIRARLLITPTWGKLAKTAPLRSSLSMNDVILKFSRPLEKAKLLLHLKTLPTCLVKFPFAGNIYHIRGHICFSDSPHTVDLLYTTLSQSLTMHTVGSQSQPVIKGQHQYFMVFTGCQLQEEVLKDWLRKCTKQKPEKKKHVTQADLSKQDIANIHREHHLKPLPSGWFYNGAQFVSMSGDRSDLHPCLNEFISSFLERKNKSIDEYNSAIEKEKYPDLFA